MGKASPSNITLVFFRSNTPKTSSSYVVTTNARVSTVFMASTTNVSVQNVLRLSQRPATHPLRDRALGWRELKVMHEADAVSSCVQANGGTISSYGRPSPTASIAFLSQLSLTRRSSLCTEDYRPIYKAWNRLEG